MPFGDYADFQDCVEQNQDKTNPEAFCSWLHHEITGEWPSEKELEKSLKKGEKDVDVKKDQNAKESLEQKINDVRRAFERTYGNMMVIHVFDDAVILQEYGNGKYYEGEYSFDNDNVIVGELKEVDLVYIQKRLGGAELTGPIFKKEEKQRIVYAAVLVPGEPDHDFDKGEKLLSETEIEQVAHKWMEDYGNIDYMHGMNNVAKPVESFILPFDWEVNIGTEKTKLPKGTWILAGKITNDKAWKEVEEGKLTGFSIMGIQNNVLKAIMKKVSDGESVNKEFQSSLKRVLIRDLGKDWIVPFVSLVDEPCVPKAKFFAVKQKEQEDTLWSKMVKFFQKDDFGQIEDTANKLKDMTEKAGRSISESTYNDLKKAIEALQKLISKADNERKEKYAKNSKGDELDMKQEDVLKMIDERLDEKLKPISEGMAKLTKSDEDVDKDNEGDEDNVNKDKPDEGDDVNKDNDENVNKDKEPNKELETLKSENEKLQKMVETLVKEKEGKSKAEKGQEDGDDKKEYTEKDQLKDLNRDSYGRAVKKGDE